MTPAAGAGPMRVTWVGHATAVIEVAGVRVLTDPALTPTLAHLRRRGPAPTADDLEADVVVVSHLHMDHLHRPSLRRVASAGRRVVVPAGAAPLVRGLGFGAVEEVRAGDRLAVGDGVAIDVVPAEHSDRRGAHSRVRAPAVGFVVDGAGRRAYFAGDTGPFAAMADIGAVDVALLPIWGWGPWIGPHHLDPATAAAATAALGAGAVIPIHWGTYHPVRARRGDPPWLDRPLPAFRAALAARGLEDRLLALPPGGTARLG